MNPKSFPRISETEWEVMRALWAGHPASAGEITKRLLQSDPTWHPKTVQTLLTRLVKKGALGYERRERGFGYRPLVTERACVRVASNSFLSRVFGGALKPMLAHFMENERLTPADINELEELLERKRRKY